MVAALSCVPVAPVAASVLPSERGQTFSSDRRLKQRQEFDRVLSGRGIPGKWFVVHHAENAVGVSRLGIIVAKRTVPAAVHRNFAKRLIRESFRLNFPAGCGVDVVVRVRRRLDEATSAEGRAALLKQFGAILA